jgi:hypothetical protein
LIDYVHFYGNVTEANIVGKMTFRVEYSAKSAYNLQDMSAKSWEQIAKKLLSDDQVFATFSKYYNALADNGDFCNGDAHCRRVTGCSALWLLDWDYDLCMKG